LAPYLKEKRTTPEDIIFNEGSDVHRIYFIMQGNVEMFLKRGMQTKKIKTLKKGDLFG
jgi:signal-transduction protein with cAMP-binding, CBS, and nucleotidyltransferase domain